MASLVKNNATGVLASGIADTDTSLTLQSGQGARFPSPTGSEYFWATLVDASNNIEIVKCTAVSTDTLTITRAQQGTTARAYSAGDRCELRITAEHLNEKLSLSGGDPEKEGNPAYLLKGYVYLTSGTSATYTTPAGVRAIEVEVIGAGGGGGGTDGTDTVSSGAGGTGGGGGWARALITNPAASYTYTVGAGGTAGAAGNNAGGTGGTTTFTGSGVTISATGGAGGSGNIIDTSNTGVPGDPGQGSLTGITGEVGGGVRGSYHRYHSNASTTSYATRGFCPLIGQGPAIGYGADGSEGVGTAGILPGEGGNGSYTSTDTSNRAGGAGFRGRIKITEYY